MGLLRKAIKAEFLEHEEADSSESSLQFKAPEADFPETETCIDTVEVKEDFSLDEMGMALKERIARLSDEPSTPYTVLSLLKAYGNFQSALCLALKDGAYSIIASLGRFSENASIPAESVWSGENTLLPFFKLDSQGKQALSFTASGEDYWIIPLSAPAALSIEPWKGLVILGVTGSDDTHTNFDAQSIAAILSGNEGKLLPKQHIVKTKENIQAITEENTGDDSTSEDLTFGQNPPGNNSIQEKLSQYHQSHEEFNCIILEIPESAGEDEKLHFYQNVTQMVGMAGNVIDLSSGCPLILLPREADRELIAHRLSGSLNTKPIMSFKTNSPENACETISSLL